MNRSPLVSAAYRTAFVALALLGILGVQRAQAGSASVRELYALQKFDDVIVACRGKTDHESTIMRALALSEKAALYRQSVDKKDLDAATKSLKDELAAADLELLADLAAISTNPNGSALATKLMQGVLQRVSTLEDMNLVVEALKANPGPLGTEAALKSVARHLDYVRAYVNDGGTMPEPERLFFAREDLIALLVGQLETKGCASVAQKCLVLIEEPALMPCESRGGEAALETARKIRAAIATREKKLPGSAWHGKH
ncbi:MAG: hypothetical protein IPG61_08410 [bacterium]|nr:hypothetical protein [bacterium]